MICEFRTYALRPNTLAEFIKRFGDALPRREKFSKLAAFWYTEIGPLNQVIHLWPYENALERSRIRAAAVKDGCWPPDTGEFIVEMRAEIFDPMPFSPPLNPSSDGPFFEMCTSTLKPFAVPKMVECWQESLQARTELSPLTGVFASDVGHVNQWLHIWPYKSLDQRAAVRSKATAERIWPPGDAPVLREESKILLPAPFSPIR